jgi:hypothetical protein
MSDCENEYLVVKERPPGYPDESWGPIIARGPKQAAEEAQQAANAEWTQHAEIRLYELASPEPEEYYSGDEI